MSPVIILIYILVIYAALRLAEFGLVKAWQAYRNRPERDQRIVLKGDEDDFRRPARPQLHREDGTGRPSDGGEDAA